MRSIRGDQLADILEAHGRWLNSNGREGERANLSRSDLSGASLGETRLAMADLSGSRLIGAYLVLSDLSQANLSDADLTGADLSGADILLANLSDANLSDADLSVADLSGANLAGASLVSALATQADLSGADLSAADLTGADLTGANFSTANLSGARLHQTRLSEANLTGANLSGARLILVSMLSSRCERIDLTGATIDATTLSQIPGEAVERFKGLIQTVDLRDPEAGFMIRETRVAPFHHSAALAVVAHFASIIARKYQHDGLRTLVELAGPIIALRVETSAPRLLRTIEDLVDTYALFLSGGLSLEALAATPGEKARLEGLMEQVKTLLRLEHDIAVSDKAPAEEPDVAARWLLRHVGRSLGQHGRSDDPWAPASTGRGPQAFLSVLKGLMEHHDADRPELALMFQKISMKGAPDETDILEMEKTLTLIQKKSPNLFQAITEAFHQTEVDRSASAWAEVVSEMLDHLV